MAKQVKQCSSLERVGSLLTQHLPLQRRRFDLIRSGLSTQPIFSVSFRKMLFPSPEFTKLHHQYWYINDKFQTCCHTDFATLRLCCPAVPYHSPHLTALSHHTSTPTELLVTGFDLPNATYRNFNVL